MKQFILEYFFKNSLILNSQIYKQPYEIAYHVAIRVAKHYNVNFVPC